MNKKTKLILISSIIIIIILSGIGVGVTYLVNNGYTKAESNIEDTFYDQLNELENMDQEVLEEDEISFLQSIGNIFIGTTHAEGNNYTPLKLKKSSYLLLEKYYILANLDTSKFPMDIFRYGRKNWDEMPKILNAYDYLNKTSTLAEFIALKKEFNSNPLYEETIRDKLTIIIKNYFINKKTKNDLTFLPKDINDDESYKFIINGLKNHKYLISTSKELGDLYNFDSDITLAAVLTEQFRYAGTYRGNIKKYMKNTPFLFSMTQFSYGIGGIKESTGYKIEQDSMKYGFGKVYKKKNEKLPYKIYTKKRILQDPYWETVYPNMLVLNIITRWGKEGFSIKNKPGIILTLYNFGNLESKKPHGDPKIGGAIIKLNEKKNREYTFGGLGESLYYYIKIYGLNK